MWGSEAPQCTGLMPSERSVGRAHALCGGLCDNITLVTEINMNWQKGALNLDENITTQCVD